MDYWRGKYASACKACGKLGGSGGRLSLIAGLDCWTGLLDWIAGLDSEERYQTSMQDCMCSEDLCLARSYGRS